MNLLYIIFCVLVFWVLAGLIYSIVFTDAGRKYCNNCKYYHPDHHRQCHVMRRIRLGSKYNGSLRTHNLSLTPFNNYNGDCEYYEPKEAENDK